MRNILYKCFIGLLILLDIALLVYIMKNTVSTNTSEYTFVLLGYYHTFFMIIIKICCHYIFPQNEPLLRGTNAGLNTASMVYLIASVFIFIFSNHTALFSDNNFQFPNTSNMGNDLPLFIIMLLSLIIFYVIIGSVCYSTIPLQLKFSMISLNLSHFLIPILLDRIFEPVFASNMLQIKTVNESDCCMICKDNTNEQFIKCGHHVHFDCAKRWYVHDEHIVKPLKCIYCQQSLN